MLRYGWWAIAFIVCDVLIGAALIMLLCSRERSIRGLEWLFPFRGRWLWYFLMTLTAVGYAALSPLFLYLLITLKK